VLLVFGAPCQLRLLEGQEHGRTIPLTDIAVLAWHIANRMLACRGLRFYRSVYSRTHNWTS
jgi:hypothetical protein